MDVFDRRVPLYTYLRPLLTGRRVLELGNVGGPATELLGKLGATLVASAPAAAMGSPATWRAAVDERARYDVVLLPEGEWLVRGKAGFDVAALARLLTPGGFVVCAVDSSDRRDARGGVGYYELNDVLAAQFPAVRMFGQTPFAAMGIAEFEGVASGLQVDSTLVDPESEEPTHYVAIAGTETGPALGYGLIQIPVPALVGREAAAGKPPRVPSAREAASAAPSNGDGELRDLRRRMTETEGRADGLARVNRAQGEELEELRARLRRAAEGRAELDEEVTRLRRSLAEADESVLTLTRRTTEEVAALAQRLTSGLRGPVADDGRSPELAAVLERLRERETTLARRESELAERDERIAALEAEKQELAWREQESQEEVRQLRHARATAGQPAARATGPSQREIELQQALAMRDRALEEYQRAARAHLDDTGRLRAAVAEQETLVAELQDELAVADERRLTAERDAARLRRSLTEAEDADRARRSRLAELEGTLLRLQREKAMAAEREKAMAAERDRTPAPTPEPVDPAPRAQLLELEERLRAMQSALQDAGAKRDDAERKWADAVDRMTGLQAESAAERRELVQDRDALEAKVVAMASSGQSPALRVAEQDLTRLRTALEKSEEALHQARAQIFPLRGRIGTLEQALAARDAAERSMVARLMDELLSLEAGLRTEASTLGEIEGALDTLGKATVTSLASASDPYP